MAWPEPQYSFDQINAAGQFVAEAAEERSFDFDQAVAIIDSFRATHNMPLNTFQTTLRAKSDGYLHSLVTQRVKRFKAIRFKLKKRTDKPIVLTEMQDIGGCRVVLSSVSDVEKLFKTYLQSDLKHKMVSQDDYITAPKVSGYRGIHICYSYYSDKKPTYNGLRIELQFRTQLQHAWATAVEIVGFFRKELLKSSEGDPVWKQFFKLMAGAIALEEGSALGVPNVSTDKDKLRDQISRTAERLDALTFLHTVGQGVKDVREITIPGAHYFLLELDTAASTVIIKGYKLSAGTRASMDYAQIERSLLGQTDRDAVLVSAKSMAELRRSYVNYFLDMGRFIEFAEGMIR